MYKGYKRRVIVVKDTKSRLFDSAYFVLREDASEENVNDMVKEASRIISENVSKKTCPLPLGRFFVFSLAAALSSVFFTAVFLLFG